MNDNKNVELVVYSFNKDFLNAEDGLRKLTNSECDKMEAYFYISALLHRAMDCYDRISNLEKKEKDIVLGFKYANNCLKHNPSLSFFHYEVSEATLFPILLDGKTSSFYHCWSSLDYVELEKGREKINTSQRAMYKKYLEGKAVLHTFRYLVRQINLCHMQIKENPFNDNYLYKYAINYDWEKIFDVE